MCDKIIETYSRSFNKQLYDEMLIQVQNRYSIQQIADMSEHMFTASPSIKNVQTKTTPNTEQNRGSSNK